MTEKRSPYLDAFLATVDFRSPASLLEVAAQLEATLPMQDRRIYDKAEEVDLMRDARNETYQLAQRLRAESLRLRKREDFEEHPSFAEQNDARIKGDSPNPVIHD